MTEQKLDCCVVRDLLPTYIEELTEPETTALVKEHLSHCAPCQKLETDMRAHVPVEKAPQRALNFLKKVKRTRLIAAILAALLTLWCMWWLYDQEFHYPNTEAGRLAAVEDYIPSPEYSILSHEVTTGTPLRVVASATEGKYLYIAYAAENEDNVHGVISLIRGWNGKYRPIRASESPFPYTAGVSAETVWTKESEERVFAFAGDNCREIYAMRVVFRATLSADSSEFERYSQTYTISEPNFLWLLPWDSLEAELGLAPDSVSAFWVEEIRLLDQDGRDITEQYRDDSVDQSWGGGKGTAERGLVYGFMVIVAWLGIVFVRYFLRQE